MGREIQSTFHMGIRPYKDYQLYREMIAQVNQAAMENRCIEMACQPLKDDAAAIRTVEPYKIRFYEGTIYIIGLCHLRNENEMFRIREYIGNNPTQWATDKDTPFIESKDSWP